MCEADSAPYFTILFAAALLAADHASLAVSGLCETTLQAIQSFDIINITVFSILKLYTQLTDMGKHVSLCWIPSHVGIKGNEMADKAAKDDTCSVITQIKIPLESFFPYISKLCMEEWQDSWDSITCMQ